MDKDSKSQDPLLVIAAKCSTVREVQDEVWRLERLPVAREFAQDLYNRTRRQFYDSQ